MSEAAKAVFTGVLPVFKEKGFTSNDVVAKLRGILHMKKIGHTGTLDPEATGVLPVCLGRATKLVGCLTDSDKTYQCTMRLGVITDTEDMTGNVISEKDASYLTDDEIRSAVISFTGGYDQIPPMYSAKKVNGRKLYELAREGITIERKPSRVYIRSIDDIVVERRDDEVRAGYRVECSKGTYIRSLCRDIGEVLGVGAVMESLERTRAAGVGTAECLTLSDIEARVSDGSIREYILPIEHFYMDAQRLDTDSILDKAVRNGNRFSCREAADGMYRVYLSDGTFAAVYEIKNGEARLCRYFLE